MNEVAVMEETPLLLNGKLQRKIRVSKLVKGTLSFSSPKASKWLYKGEKLEKLQIANPMSFQIEATE